jgi:hypothetical protein
MWNEVQKLEGQTLRTLDQKKGFDIVEVQDSKVIVFLHSTETQRPIHRREIEDSFQRLRSTGQITRSEIRENFSQFNPAYVAAILAALPGVKHSIRPIRLKTTDKA